MNDGLKIIITAALTLFGGVVLLIISKSIEVLVIVPLQKYKEHAQNTLERIDFYANQLTNYFPEKPNEKEILKAELLRVEIRKAATELKSAYVVISFKGVLTKMKVLPRRTELEKAFGSLIFLSNNLPLASREKGRSPERNLIDMNDNAIKQVQLVLGE
jgi:hypothetical protein